MYLLLFANRYVVINLAMQRNCKEEAVNDTRECQKGDAGINIYNTAVAFDRTGTVVSVYRKYNLFMEDHLVRRTLKPDIAWFDTDFGVRFGLLICFDLLFQSPAQQLLDFGVRNFVYPTMWYSELPFMTGRFDRLIINYRSKYIQSIKPMLCSPPALQVQQGVAFAKNVNLLAAGASNPKLKQTGSGLYSGRFGALKAIIVDTAVTKVLVAKLPKVPGTPIPVTPAPASSTPKAEAVVVPETIEVDRQDLNGYEIKWLDFPGNATQSGRTCHGKVCCSYSVNVTVPRNEPSGVSPS